MQGDFKGYRSYPELPRPVAPRFDVELKNLRNWIQRPTRPEGWLNVSTAGEVSSAIERVVAEAAQLLALGSDWDGEGAKRIDEGTWRLAMDFLRRLSLSVRSRYGLSIPAPKIGPCSDGSIDLYWKFGQVKALINVQPRQMQSDFYGENSRGFVIRGKFSPDRQGCDFFLPVFSD